MMQILLIVHLLIVLSLIGVVLLQKSEGGGLGIGGGSGGGSGGMGGFMTGRGTANFLSRTTAILAVCFMATSISLSILAGTQTQPTSILDDMGEQSDTPVLQDGGEAAPEDESGSQPAADESGESSDPSVPIQ
ncbi:preprotein translocase subunit SecG [Fodinicurvata halophila]|uniref:Protein-export membrane protein SecG n=1 Tax=Fodinicurvata halophila TaxID=1419723 RepID=A0ABV8UKT7_9PROT